MKNTLFAAAALLVGSFAQAQTDTTTRPLPDTTARPVPDTTMVTLVDTSVGKAYVSNEAHLMSLTTETVTPADVFPALGTYQGNGSSTEEVTISLDETNKGIVWVDGLPQGKFKALMKKAPATYKIPAQSAEGGKAIAEGTLYVNPDTKEVTIVVGQAFNDKEPIAALEATTKKNGWRYTGVKAETAKAAPVDVPHQQ